MSQTPYLISPSMEYKDSFLAALREFHAEGYHIDWDYDDVAGDFEGFVQSLIDRIDKPMPNRVPEHIMWLVDGEHFIGRTGIRHELNDFLKTFGGHIGYDIRPTMRRRGHGTLICKLALDVARSLGLTRVMLTCDDSNVGSAKIIEANGGILHSTYTLDWRDTPTRQYWIDLTP